MDTPTIAAIASPPGSGGIGIIKISGPDAIRIATHSFRQHKNTRCEDLCFSRQVFPELQSHRLYYGHIVDPEKCEILDEVLLIVMRAPRSYTREDVVEIQAHSGPAVMRNILSLVIRQGAQMAEPGEFTRRAFLNGRIDLTQAEAVIDLINARTDTAFKAAANQVTGRLREVVESVRSCLSDLLVQVEAGIDFPEDMADIGTISRAEDRLLQGVAEPIEDLIRSYREAHIYREGIELAIVGRPNVGKSSLLNCLVEKDRVIVNPLPGTTRDLVDCTFQLHGIPVTVTDTAGIHITADPVEQIGISKTHECIDDSHLILLVLDASESVRESDDQVYEQCHQKPVIYVINKTDLVDEKTSHAPMPPTHWNPAPNVRISALHGTGIDLLKAQIFSAVVDDPQSAVSHAVIPNFRHHESLEKCYKSVTSVTKGLHKNWPAELIAIDIREALNWLDDILGTRVEEDILERIFNRFCIGK